MKRVKEVGERERVRRKGVCKSDRERGREREEDGKDVYG